jgi:hypothetical protein
MYLFHADLIKSNEMPIGTIANLNSLYLITIRDLHRGQKMVFQFQYQNFFCNLTKRNYVLPVANDEILTLHI